MEKGGEGLFHPHGRAAAADVAGEAEQLLDGDEVDLLVAGGVGRLFQVNLAVAGDDADKVAGALALEHDGFEDTVYVLAQLVGDVLRLKVVLVDGVLVQHELHARLLQQAHGIGLCDSFASFLIFCHPVDFLQK